VVSSYPIMWSITDTQEYGEKLIAAERRDALAQETSLEQPAKEFAEIMESTYSNEVNVGPKKSGRDSHILLAATLLP
jgi:hypothetical protein